MRVNPAVLDRIVKAVNFEGPDRVPIWESLQNQRVYEHCAPEVLFPECAGIACETLGIDATYGCMNPVTEEGREGSTVYAGQTAWQTEPAFRVLDDLRSYDPGPIDEGEHEERMLTHHERRQALYGPNVLYLPAVSENPSAPRGAAIAPLVAFAGCPVLPKNSIRSVLGDLLPRG